MHNLQTAYSQSLLERQAQNRLRTLYSSRILENAEVEVGKKNLCNLASNDYLGLSQHPEIKKRAIEYTKRYGTGATASRLLAGNLEVFEKLERKIAYLKGTEDALILPSGFQANMTVIAALGLPDTLIACDRLNHNSIFNGLLLSKANWFSYHHNDLVHLTQRLKDKAPKPNYPLWIISESVFSMDGDTADIAALQDCATKYGGSLYLDEAHATGVFGKNGMGLGTCFNSNDIIMGTFSKGLGSFGSYIACSRNMKNYLTNFCSGFIYSTALPPPVLGSIDAALDLVPGLESKRNYLQELAQYTRSQLSSSGFDTGMSQTQIIPIILGSDKKALALSQYLTQHGFLVPAIRPPAVPETTARLRLSLSSEHTKSQIDSFLKVLRSWHEKDI